MRSITDEFYIGWQAKAPDGIVRRIKQAIIALNIIVPIIGGIIVLHQRGFSDSAFEYGVTTEVSGVLMKSPAPFLQVARGKDLMGQHVYQYILLVAPGKHGIQEMLQSREAELGHSLEGRMVSLKGFLIYHDGKTLIEVESMRDITDQGVSPEALIIAQPYGQGAIIGEITDPKCLFGVMKPGQGKPHRSCAARCIAGGIPPVLKAGAPGGAIYYYMVVREDGSPINNEILSFVGDQVAVCGQVKKLGNWLVLYKDATMDIQLVKPDLGRDLTMCR